jgi:PQQ-dependent dehydrogenase (methanol/ethanol family)
MSKNFPKRFTVEPEDRQHHLDTGEAPSTEKRELVQKAPGSDVSDELLRNDENRADSWLQYNKGLGQTGFSTAYRLSPDNVVSLSEQWSIDTGSQGLQTNPIVVPGDPPVMYFTQSNYTVKAVNARTGDEYWTFEYSPSRVTGIGSRNRGVVAWQDKVYLATTDTKLVALDRYTGEKQWEADVLMEGQLPERHGITQAPTVYDGKLFVGQSGDALGWSSVQAYDAESGEKLWQFKTLPEEAWVEDTWKFGNGSSWMSPAVDHVTDTVVFPIANPTPYFNGVVRPGPNKHTNSLIAVDPTSGERKWINQQLPHEFWDYDTHSTPLITDLDVRGEERRVALVNHKTAWTFVVDMETGQTIARSLPWGIQDHQFGGSTYLEMPPNNKEDAGLMYPAPPGATEWTPDTFSPKTGLLYLGVLRDAVEVWYDPDWTYESAEKPTEEEGGWPPAEQRGGGFESPEDLDRATMVKAVDPTGDVEWSYTFKDVDNVPFQFAGGVTATASNLVFAGSPGGNLVALDANTGERRWAIDTGARITASPIVWDDPAKGRQYVTVASGQKVISYAAEGT